MWIKSLISDCVIKAPIRVSFLHIMESETRGKTGDVRLHKATNAADFKKLLTEFEVADHDTLDSNGDAPLHCLVKRKDIRAREKFNCLMTFLLYSKCNVNMLNVDGQTALHLACQDNNVQIAKALIAFDVKINAVSIYNKTPLDIVLQRPTGSTSDELENLLFLLGALRYQEMSTGNEARAEGMQSGSGTATTEMEDDVFVAEPAVNEHEYEHRQLRQKLTPGLIPTLPEEGARREADEEPVRQLVTPNSSSGMGLMNLAAKMENQHLEEQSVTNIATSSSELDKTTFLSSDSCSRSSEPGSTSPEVKMAEGGNVEAHSSSEASSKADAATGIEEEVDGNPSEKLEQLWRSKAQTSPDLFRHFRVTRPAQAEQHVHFSDQKDSGNDSQRRGEIAARRRNIFRHQNSGICLKSVSEYNPEMEVMRSMVGENCVPFIPERREGVKILCLDGGGMKGLIQIEILKMIEQIAGKSITELFDWVVATSTGAITALGVIYGKASLEDMKHMNFTMQDQVIKRRSNFISPTCDTTAWEDSLKGRLGTTTTMNSVKKPNVLVTAVNKSTTALPVVFFNNCLDNDYSKQLVWKVARYTSAAPVMFTECDNYVDGGIKANNPTTYGLAEIQSFLDKKYGRGSPDAKISCVVSVGCGIYPPEPLGNTDIADALKVTSIHKVPSRLKELLNLFRTALATSEEMSRLCHINCEHQGIAYFRFSPEIGEDIGTAEKDKQKLCQIIIRAKQLFKENAEQVESMIKQLGYEIKKNYLHNI